MGAAGPGGFGFHYARLGISGRAARPRKPSRRVYEIVCLRGSGLDVAANYLSARERLGCSIGVGVHFPFPILLIFFKHSGYSLELPRQGGTIYVLSRNKKNNVYPCKPQFYYMKVGFKGVKIM